MDSTQPTKQRKPRKPRLTNGTKPNPVPQVNPLEASIKQARKAYGSTVGESDLVPPNATQTAKEGSLGKDGEGKAGQGASTLTPPAPRAHGKLTNPAEYVNSLAPELIREWATDWLCSGNRQRYLRQLQPAIGRENDRWRADMLHALESHPVALEAIEELRAERVMSDLQRREKLRKIAETEEHALRGFSDQVKAIELDAKLDPESNLGRRTESQAGMTFNAPVSLFFMPSTQARTVALEAQPALQAQPITLDVAPPLTLPPVGGSPG